MRQDPRRETDALATVDDDRSWDCFVGPTAFMQDDRYAAGLMPLMLAAKTMAFAADMNAKMIEGMITPGKRRH